MLGVAERQGEALGEPVRELHMEKVWVPWGEALGRERVGCTVVEGWEAVPHHVVLSVGEAEVVEVRERECVPEAQRVGVEVCVGLAVLLAVLVEFPGELEALKEEVLEAVVVAVRVLLPVPETEGEEEAVLVLEELEVAVTVLVLELDTVVVEEALGEPVAAAVTVTVTVSVGEPDREAVLELVVVEVTVELPDQLPVKVPVALRVLLLLADTVTEGLPE